MSQKLPVCSGPALALSARGLKPAARARLFAAWSFADYEWAANSTVPPLIWPSIASIAAVHGVQRRTAAAGLEAARKCGYIIPLVCVAEWSRESMSVLVNHEVKTGAECKCFALAEERCSCRLLVPIFPDPDDPRFGRPIKLPIDLVAKPERFERRK